jgi:hypothetical protein
MFCSEVQASVSFGTDVPEEYVASIFSAEDAKQEIGISQVESLKMETLLRNA